MPYGEGNVLNMAGSRRPPENCRKERCLNNLLKNIGIWLVIGLVVLTVVKQFDSRQTTEGFDPLFRIHGLGQGRQRRLGDRSRAARSSGSSTDKKRFTTYSPGDIWMVGDLVKYGVKVEAKPEEEQASSRRSSSRGSRCCC